MDDLREAMSLFVAHILDISIFLSPFMPETAKTIFDHFFSRSHSKNSAALSPNMKQRMISIAPTVFELFPDVQIGLIVAWNLNNRERSDELTRLLRDEEMHARTLFSAVNISQHPVIQSWRKAYTRFGGSSSYRSSIEALAKRALKGDVLPEINPLVDCYNLTSLKYMMPVGGEDCSTLLGTSNLHAQPDLNDLRRSGRMCRNFLVRARWSGWMSQKKCYAVDGIGGKATKQN